MDHQSQVAARIDLYGPTDDPTLIAAVDTAYGTSGDRVFAAATCFTFPDLQPVEKAFGSIKVDFPYIPGFIFYREGQAVLEALNGLNEEPDLIMVHGHGIAHPKRCGMACQIGFLTGKRTIGCARRLLVGRHRHVDLRKGSSEPIVLGQREVGIAYRSKDNVKPIFISPGFRCDLDFSRDIIVRCLRGYRLPEPLRVAHLLANKHRRNAEDEQANGRFRSRAYDIREDEEG